MHNHTEYSLLDGLTRIGPLMDLVAASGMQAVAITDHGTLSGAIEFYSEALARDLKPIIGMEAYVAARQHTDKDPVKDKPRYHLIVLAMNSHGYQNLLRLSTLAHLQGYYYYPRIDHELLEAHNEGLIIISGCLNSEVGDALRQGQYDKAKTIAEWYKKVFGDRYYLEVQDHGHPDSPQPSFEQGQVNEQTLKLAKELRIPVVLTCDAHYLKHEDQEAHEILLCIGTGSYMSDTKRMSLKDYQLHVTEPGELIARWGKTNPEVISNTKILADRCSIKLDLGKILIPKFPLPSHETEKSLLRRMVYNGLVLRYSPAKVSASKAKDFSLKDIRKFLSKEVVDRALFELKVIDDMDFNGYFLIISDFVNWGKDQGIVFGPGRGSAAGSIVSYALRITELDPLNYDLLFERFLNPDRISMPDIDIDIQDNRRDEVIAYCIDKYGKDRVASIVTFGRMFARNAVRDVARVLEVAYADADRLAKMIPLPIQGRHVPLPIMLDENSDLKKEYNQNPTSKMILDQAIILEGTIRSHGVHAAGVVIAPDEIVKFVPLEVAQKGAITTQYSMGPIEDLGLLKIDFLGLATLTIIKNALRIIKKVYKTDIDINNLPLDDAKTFNLLQKGSTIGVFQFESSGMKRYLKELKPTVFDDIIAMGALYRPGPLTAGLTQRFINRKNGVERITYEHPSMTAALESTYGVLVYQEQVMRIAQDMCGFTGGEADTLRKAIGKKKRDVMAKMKQKFIDGAVKTVGATPEFAAKFWKDLEGFADYAFNKSHSACYGLISFQTAYLKAHYPMAFMAALMTSDFDNTDRLAIEIAECSHMGIEVMAPDVNESFVEFAVVPKTSQIRFGLAAIKNVGTGAVEEILRARQSLGGFLSLEDFIAAVNSRVVNRKTLESLIKAGAFDRYNERATLLDNLETIIAYASRLNKHAASGQVDLFGDSQLNLGAKTSLNLDISAKPASKREKLQWERELLGLYLSDHPLTAFNSLLAGQTTPTKNITVEQDDQEVVVGGAIVEKREITTKNGQKMAFVKFADQFGELEIVIFPKLYIDTLEIWERDRIVLVKGRVSFRGRDGSAANEPKIIAAEASELDLEKANSEPVVLAGSPPAAKLNKSFASVKAKRLYLRLIDSQDHQALQGIKTLIEDQPGSTEVILVIGPEHQKQALKLPGTINYSLNTADQFAGLVGKTNVKLH